MDNKSLTSKNFKKKKNFILDIVKKFANKDQRRGLSHSLIQSHRYISNCNPECPSFIIRKYVYKPKNSNKIIESKNPISTLKKHWKIKEEGRIISINLFGNDSKYYEGFMEFLESIELIKKHNNIKTWFLDTFTFRVYIAKGILKKENETPDKFIKLFIEKNVELVFVDTNNEKYNLDGSFWRFLIMDEKIRSNSQIRFLCRDADWKMTAVEALMISEWINSKYIYHRINLFPICAGPLLAGLIGGVINNNTNRLEIRNKMENYPYRYEYGDDELFLRDLIWPHILNSNSILTHTNKKNYKYTFANPYENSCFEPTNNYCKKFSKKIKNKKEKKSKNKKEKTSKLKTNKNGCVDIILPDEPLHYSVKFSSEISLTKMFKENPNFFTFNIKNKNYKKWLKQMNIKLNN